MNYIVVDGTGVVANVIVWDGETSFEPGEGYTLEEQPEDVGIGWQRRGGEWIAPTITQS